MQYDRVSLTVIIYIALSFIWPAHANDGMGIKEAERACNGERGASHEEIIRGCTRVIQYGGDAFSGVKYAYVNRAFAYRATGQCELALADFHQAIRMRVTKPYIYRGRGSVFLCLKRYHDALADLDFVIKNDPNDAWAYLYRGRAYLGLGDPARAKADFDRAVALDPELADNVASSR
jgi:tetratricopeptide (TPR) repeat protein